MENKKRLLYLVVALVLGIIGGTILFGELGFKVLAGLFLVIWGNNISNSDTFKKN